MHSLQCQPLTKAWVYFCHVIPHHPFNLQCHPLNCVHLCKALLQPKRLSVKGNTICKLFVSHSFLPRTQMYIFNSIKITEVWNWSHGADAHPFFHKHTHTHTHTDTHCIYKISQITFDTLSATVQRWLRISTHNNMLTRIGCDLFNNDYQWSIQYHI